MDIEGQAQGEVERILAVEEDLRMQSCPKQGADKVEAKRAGSMAQPGATPMPGKGQARRSLEEGAPSKLFQEEQTRAAQATARWADNDAFVE